jgi:hypothetical protein
MGEPTVFDYWRSENNVNYRWQLNTLRSMGINGTVDTNNVVTFVSSVDSPLAKFLDGKSFNVLTWEEIPVKITVEEKPAVLYDEYQEKKVDDVASTKVFEKPKQESSRMSKYSKG